MLSYDNLMKEAYSGGLLEHELFGANRHEKIARGERPSYYSYNQSVEEVEKIQIGDPSDPEAKFANDLHATIAEKLGLEDYTKLSFYNALGTSLDYYHGVDAFFKYKDKEGNTHRITLDLTKNPNKDDYKADVILYVNEDDLDFVDHKDRYPKLLDSATNKILLALHAKQILKEGRKNGRENTERVAVR